MSYEPDIQPRHPADAQRAPGAAGAGRTARGSVGQRHPHRPDGPRADPDHRRPRAGTPPGPRAARPGFSYAEKFVGTNGIGTALEVGGPTHVFGHEHYAENLEDLACAGVPIHHPISGRLVGAVDLTCWRRDAGALLLTLAKTTAEQIRQALLTDAGLQRAGAVQGVPAHLRRRTGIVFALNQRHRDAERLRPDGPRPGGSGGAARAGQRDLGAAAAGVARSSSLPSGQTARMFSRPVDRSELPRRHRRPRQAGGAGREAAGIRRVHLPLPGLVGSGPLWLTPAKRSSAPSAPGEWLAVAGEPGVGKLAVLTRGPAASAAGRPAAGRGRRRRQADPDWMPPCPTSRRRRGRLPRRTTRRRPRRPPASRAVLGPGSRVDGRPEPPAVGGRHPGATTPTARHCSSCCSCSRAPSSCRRCACIARTCRRW